MASLRVSGGRSHQTEPTVAMATPYCDAVSSVVRPDQVEVE
jgi:hypothetical protein